MLLTAQGHLLVDWADDRVELRSQAGETIWITDFKALPGFERIFVYDLAEEADGNFLAVGVESTTPPRTVLFRVFATAGQAALLNAGFDVAPGSLMVAPGGQRYLLGLSAANFNRLVYLSATKRLPADAMFEDFLIHELDAQGRLQSSIFRIQKSIRRGPGLAAIESRLNSHRLVFSPQGKAYIRHLREPWISEMDLESGTRGKTLHFAGGEFTSGLYIPSLEFVSEEMFSATIMSQADRGLVFEVRSVDLSTGTSWTRFKGEDGSTTPVSVVLDRISEDVLVIPLAGRSRATVVNQYPILEFKQIRTDPFFR
ncbi:MAG TPA: hypothetical protein VLU25_01075 [Acidobacteriota bacterium]|nr:hypothetical protein [Acidobacteriota bacterium]